MNYEVTQVLVDAGVLSAIFDKALPSGFSLTVDGTAYSVASGSLSSNGMTVTWSNTGLSWSTGDTVSLSLTAPATTTPPPTTTTEYLSDTLVVQAVDYGFGCGYRTGQPTCHGWLRDNSGFFNYHGGDYKVELVHVAYGDTLQLILDADPVDADGTRTERSRMALNVGSKQFLVKDAMVSYGIADGNVWTNEDAWVLTWTNSGLSWSEGDSVSLSLVTLPVGGL